MAFPSKIKLPWWSKLNWRNTKVLPVLFIVELPFTIACLALFGMADPDTYRTSLWKEGATHGWNSDPIEILYSYANYRPMAPPTPWNQFVTDWNVVISVLSMFILLAKVVMYITHVLPPFFSAILHAFITILYAVSISQQAGSDYSDPDHPSQFPWYLTRGCGAPVTPSLSSACQMAKASFAVTVVMTALFLTYTIFSIISAIPTKAQKEAIMAEVDDIESPSTYNDDKKWEFELDQMARTPRSPMFAANPVTPRTLAFNTLEGRMSPNQTNRTANRDLPLRHHISMGTETFQGSDTKMRYA